jgi:signal transduction histidine kinase/ligand-binding sensor domain-containing protein/CheY-like chemotaxis protein
LSLNFGKTAEVFNFAVMKHLLLICYALMFTLFVGAQSTLRQRQLTMENGLTSNTVNSIAQDRRGFIWIGTSNGICRYDGVTVATYRLPETDGRPNVNTIIVMDDERLLVGTQQGVYVFSFEHETFEPLTFDRQFSVNDIILDADGMLWIATQDQGIVSYDLASGDTNYFDLAEAGNNVVCVYVDRQNQLWAISSGQNSSLWQLNRSNGKFESMLQQDAAIARSTALLQTSDNRIWLGTANVGLMLLHNDRTTESMSTAVSGHGMHISALYELSATQLLLGCDDGVWLFDTSLRTLTLYMPQRFVNTIARDHEGGLWVGTDYSGVNYQSPIAHRFDSYLVGTVSQFCEDRQGRIWTTRENGGLDCHPKNHPELTLGSYAGLVQLEKLKTHALCMDGDDLWIGTFSDGVYVFSTVSGQLRHYKATESERSLYDQNSCTILRDRKGRIWVATMEGLCRFNRQSNDFERIVSVMSAPIDIDEDQNGCIWVATQGDGIWTYNPADGKLTTYHYNSNDNATLSHDMVNCLFIDGKERIWVGTQGGLCRFEPQRKNFTRIQLNVPRPGISAITEQQGVLWLAGDCGVLRYDSDKNLQRFTRQDGLVSEQFVPNAVLNGSDGRIYLGCNGGFNTFYPNKIKVNQLASEVCITQLEINNQPIRVGSWHLPQALSAIKQLDLWYNDNVFSLSFASLSYCSPEKNMYAYKLEGFDKHWNYVEHEHKATYTNLEPGIYTFYVKATNNDGIWSDRVAKLRIEVHPPYWWNIYAKILYVVLFVLLVTAFIRVRLYLNNRRHRKEIERLNAAKEEEMRVARTEFFTTIAHEIRTPVSLIIGPLTTLQENLQKSNATKADFDTLSVIDRNAHRLLDLVNQLLDFRKVEQGRMDMNFAPVNVRDLLASVANNFSAVFGYSGHQLKVNYPDEHFTAVVDREGMTKVLSNLLSNANKYTKDTIVLNCYELAEAKQFVIEVTDNGSGIGQEDMKRVFDPFFQTADRKPGTGIGLSIVKRIVEQHQGKVTVESELGRGTTFRIVMPVAQSFSGEQEPIVRQTESPEAPAATTVGTGEAVQPVEKPSMLIVDDNEDMLTFLVTSLMDRFEVTSARDGSEALKLIEESLVVVNGQKAPKSTFDIIISDWMMQEMDGPELCSRLRQNAATKHIPFILLTAKTDSQSKVQAMEAGVDAFIEKPFALKYLEACINNLLTRKER